MPGFEDVTSLQASVSAADSVAALGLVVQGARDLPGRKAVIFASEGFQLMSGTDGSRQPDVDPRIRSRLDLTIDQATRSGVVIYSIDCQALQTGGMRASDDIHSIDITADPDAMGAAVRNLASARLRANRDAQESLAYLAEQTGGFAVMNTNDLAGGLARISNDVRDYYVIGYEPDRETFATPGKTPRLHKITVNVRRPGLRVRARKEFIGVSDPERATGPLTPAQQLVRAAFSPFSETSIALRATNLPGYAPGLGLFVRSVLHVDAHALAFSTDASDTRKASADLVCLIFNSDGVRVDTVTTGFDVALESTAADQAIRDGLVYTTRVPIARPGGYQLRYAVRDRRSGAIGTVGGFVNVPDVRGDTLALSGLVLRSGERIATGSIDADRFSVRPADALRVYAPGTRLSYSYEIYNAGAAVQTVASLWRDTEKIQTLAPDALGRPANGAFVGAGQLALADDLAAGTYVLQIAVTAADAPRSKKSRTAVQRLSFDVR